MKRKVPGYEYVALQQPIWVDKVKLKERVLTENQGTQLDLMFWDLPEIVDQSVASDDFFRALASDRADLDIFGEPIIRIIVSRAWEE